MTNYYWTRCSGEKLYVKSGFAKVLIVLNVLFFALLSIPLQPFFWLFGLNGVVRWGNGDVQFMVLDRDTFRRRRS